MRLKCELGHIEQNARVFGYMKTLSMQEAAWSIKDTACPSADEMLMNLRGEFSYHN